MCACLQTCGRMRSGGQPAANKHPVSLSILHCPLRCPLVFLVLSQFACMCVCSQAADCVQQHPPGEEVRAGVLRHACQDRRAPLQRKQHRARHLLRSLLPRVCHGHHRPRRLRYHQGHAHRLDWQPWGWGCSSHLL